jgi:predicted protein tyrosine phosphatase
MEQWQKDRIAEDYENSLAGKTIDSLDVPDNYRYFHPELQVIIKEKVDAYLIQYQKK